MSGAWFSAVPAPPELVRRRRLGRRFPVSQAELSAIASSAAVPIKKLPAGPYSPTFLPFDRFDLNGGRQRPRLQTNRVERQRRIDNASRTIAV